MEKITDEGCYCGFFTVAWRAGFFLPLSPTIFIERVQNNKKGAMQGNFFAEKAIHNAFPQANMPFLTEKRRFGLFLL